MKTLNWIFLFAALMGFTSAGAQSTLEPEVPGDNFSLEGALELFKKSSSPEEFERMLNSPDSKVNNLDLNNDGQTDYIKVIDRNDGNVHAFILQAVISQTESQDVAVIELEKLQDGKAVLQITGDADIYGIETIIEPSQEVRVNAGTTTARTVVNVWTWPAVQYVYGPYYNPWISPWAWTYYPGWWRPWRPVAFYVYSPWWRPYRPYYSFCYTHRIGYLPRLYAPYRRTSVYVYNNYHTQINHYRSHYDGRSRNDGNHHRYDGYGGRTTSDYHQSRHDNRYASNDHGSSHHSYGSDRSHSNNSSNHSYGSDRNHANSTHNMSSSSPSHSDHNGAGRNLNRSSSNSGAWHGNSSIQHGNTGNTGHQRQSSSLNMRNYSQHSSSSSGKSAGSMPSPGGNRSSMRGGMSHGSMGNHGSGTSHGSSGGHSGGGHTSGGHSHGGRH